MDLNKKVTKLDNNQKLFLITAKQTIWLSVSEAASLGGVGGKTIRRAIKDTNSGLVFKIVKNRYQIEFRSLIIFMHKNTKLKNKFLQFGLGQYVDSWQK
jgi:hypothetical protein